MILKIAAQILVAMILLSLEQVVGLPLLFFAVVLWFSHNQSPVYRQVLLGVTGVVLAIMYQFPLAGGWLLMIVLAYGWQSSQAWLKSDVQRLLLFSLIGSGVVAAAIRFEWSWLAVGAVAVSLGLTYVFAQTALFVSTSGKLRTRPSLRFITGSKL